MNTVQFTHCFERNIGSFSNNNKSNFISIHNTIELYSIDLFTKFEGVVSRGIATTVGHQTIFNSEMIKWGG